MKWRYYEPPHSDTLACKFNDENVTITFLSSLTAMSPKTKDMSVPLKGRLP